MNVREIEVLAPKDVGAANTEPIDLDMGDVLSSIEIIWQTTVVTVSDMTDTHAACLSAIEIANGSDVLWKLSGEQAQAYHFYSQGKMPHNDISVVAAEYMRSVVPIYFGRELFDPSLALDTSKYPNLQLKVTFNEDQANASVVANSLTVRAWAFNSRPSGLQGFLAAKEIEAWTPVASGYHYVDLPTDHPIRSLLYRQAATDKNPFEVCDQLKLGLNLGDKVYFDLTGQEVFDKIVQPYGPIAQRVHLNETAADANNLYLAPTYKTLAMVDYDDDVIAANDERIQCTFAGNKVVVGATVNLVPYTAFVQGYAPHFCMPIPMGRPDDINDWARYSQSDKLRLTTQGASAVGTTPEASIVVVQHRN